MPKLTLSLFEPIEIIFPKGKTYTIETLSSELLGNFKASVKAFSEKPEDVTPESIAGVLVPLLPGMSQEEAMKVDFRYVVRIAEFLAEQITEASKPTKATEAKN
jgi:hypothetical protein